MTPGPPLVYFHRLALDELIAARRWYSNKSGGTARRFVDAVNTAVGRIQAFPNAGVLIHPPYRWVRLRRFPYVLYYGPVGTNITEVFAVAHAGRRPGYWLRRARRP